MTQERNEGQQKLQNKFGCVCRPVVQFSVRDGIWTHCSTSHVFKAYHSSALICFIVPEENRSPQESFLPLIYLLKNSPSEMQVTEFAQPPLKPVGKSRQKSRLLGSWRGSLCNPEIRLLWGWQHRRLLLTHKHRTEKHSASTVDVMLDF